MLLPRYLAIGEANQRVHRLEQREQLKHSKTIQPLFHQTRDAISRFEPF